MPRRLLDYLANEGVVGNVFIRKHSDKSRPYLVNGVYYKGGEVRLEVTELDPKYNDQPRQTNYLLRSHALDLEMPSGRELFGEGGTTQRQAKLTRGKWKDGRKNYQPTEEDLGIQGGVIINPEHVIQPKLKQVVGPCPEYVSRSRILQQPQDPETPQSWFEKLHPL